MHEVDRSGPMFCGRSQDDLFSPEIQAKIASIAEVEWCYYVDVGIGLKHNEIYVCKDVFSQALDQFLTTDPSFLLTNRAIAEMSVR